MNQSPEQIKLELAKRCDLRIYSANSQLHDFVQVTEDKVLSTAIIDRHVILFSCTPVLTYMRTPAEGSLSFICALQSSLPEMLNTISDRVTQLYPRQEEDLHRAFLSYLPNPNAEALKKQPANIIQAKCEHNAFRTDTKWFLYGPEVSRLNHSCEPNCTWKIRKNRLIVTSSRVIQPGEEITIAYLQEACQLYGKNRRNIIMNYQFYCQCSACIGRCHTCEKISNSLLRCSKCKTVSYCCQECQKDDWREHKSLCCKVRR